MPSNPVYGGDHSTGTQAGLYASSFLTDTYTTSSQQGTHGEPTAYCGLVYEGQFYTSTGYWFYSISTGPGAYDAVAHFDGGSYRDSNCSGTTHIHDNTGKFCYAACDRYTWDSYCPRSWGTYFSYRDYEPGCCNGSYYPDGRMEYRK